MMRRPPIRPAQRGIALVEALVAVVILGLGLLGTIGLQARAYSALADSGMRAEATLAAEKLFGQMTVDQANLAAYALAPGAMPGTRVAPWYNDTLARIPHATVEIDLAAAANTDGTQATVIITWTRKAGTAPSTYRVSSYFAQAT
jgi:type IV pilus assembly protein PilV